MFSVLLKLNHNVWFITHLSPAAMLEILWLTQFPEQRTYSFCLSFSLKTMQIKLCSKQALWKGTPTPTVGTNCKSQVYSNTNPLGLVAFVAFYKSSLSDQVWDEYMYVEFLARWWCCPPFWSNCLCPLWKGCIHTTYISGLMGDGVVKCL